MKRSLKTLLCTFLFSALLPLQARAAELLVPGGQIIGLELGDDSVTIAAYDDVLGSTARDAGLKIGDEILEINGKIIDSADDVRAALSDCNGRVDILVQRGSRQQTLHLSPQSTDEGLRLGIYLKQGIAGIGTVTFYDPATHRFGTLGHGVSDSQGVLLHLRRGSAYSARILSVQKGACGDPGQLRGSSDFPRAIGTLAKNTPRGVFGILEQPCPGTAIPVAAWEEVCTGPATIRSTISGDAVREYSVEILKIYPKDRTDCRNFLLRVTDPDLLAATGGIVQGMSGSPIIQNGKLVGAVTHVLVNDPTTGYGIFIENMLDAAS